MPTFFETQSVGGASLAATDFAQALNNLNAQQFMLMFPAGRRHLFLPQRYNQRIPRWAAAARQPAH
jgi:hypothetical protein